MPNRANCLFCLDTAEDEDEYGKSRICRCATVFSGKEMEVLRDFIVILSDGGITNSYYSRSKPSNFSDQEWTTLLNKLKEPE